MRDISQNFPSLMHVLSREKIPEDKAKDFEKVSTDFQSGYIWVNDIAYDVLSVSPFKYVDSFVFSNLILMTRLYSSLEKQINGLAAFTEACGVANDPELFR
jgi:hypothetical protein